MEEEISLGEIFAIIKVRLLLIISLGILGLLVSALYTLYFFSW
jgi:capsular polysaccharide biosynthesis protein